MDRRLFLQSLAGLTLTQAVSGCSSNPQATFRVRMLKQSLPQHIVKEFSQSFQPEAKLEVTPKNEVADLFKVLEDLSQGKGQRQGWSLPFTQSPRQIVPDLVSLSDAWLAKAIQKQLIQPLSLENISNWQKIPTDYQELVKRDKMGNLAPDGQVWGAPYRWGSTVIMYRRDKFAKIGWEPKDWGDLWREELKGKISLLDNYRQTIGLTLKHLGRSYNTSDLAPLTELEVTLRQLHQQVKFYSSDAYLQPLLLEDTWLAVGWSTDYLEMKRKSGGDRSIEAIIPASGTALSADLWVRPTPPATNLDVKMLPKWIDYCWEDKIANQISLFTSAASPTVLNKSSEDLPDKIQANTLLLPPKEAIAQSEFITPLAPKTETQYRQLWQKIRNN